MNRIRVLLGLLLVLFCISCGQKKANPGQDVKNIHITYTELGTETIFRITCESFDKYFPKPQVLNVISKPAIDSLMTVLDNMKVIDNDQEPDVRAKIYITHSNKVVDTVCLGTQVLKYKQLTYETPQKLLMMIQQ